MADEHHSSFKVIDSICQSIYSFDVQVVGGLIQEKHVGILPGQPRKAHTALLPVGEVPDGAHLSHKDTVCSSARELNSTSSCTATLIRKHSHLKLCLQQMRGARHIRSTPSLGFLNQQNKGIPTASERGVHPKTQLLLEVQRAVRRALSVHSILTQA